MAVEIDNRAGRLLTPSVETWIPIRSVADEREVVGDRHWRHAKFLSDPILIPNTSRSTIQLDDTIFSDALGQVLIGGADVDTRHLGELTQRGCRASERIISFQFDHGTDHDSHGFERLFKQGKLR